MGFEVDLEGKRALDKKGEMACTNTGGPHVKEEEKIQPALKRKDWARLEQP